MGRGALGQCGWSACFLTFHFFLHHQKLPSPTQLKLTPSTPPSRRFDGYRFDGVTSMMYHHHGLQTTFTGGCPARMTPKTLVAIEPLKTAQYHPWLPNLCTHPRLFQPHPPLAFPTPQPTGNYDEYFGMSTDVDAVVYLMMVSRGSWWCGVCFTGCGVVGSLTCAAARACYNDRACRWCSPAGRGSQGGAGKRLVEHAAAAVPATEAHSLCLLQCKRQQQHIQHVP